MFSTEYTITRHRNGYIEIRDCQGRFLQTADNMKEAQNDIKQLEKEKSVCFSEVLATEIAKIGG